MSKPCTYGGYKTCQTCGKVFYVLRPEMWAYKCHVGAGADEKTLYFHTYSCKRKFDKKYERQKIEHRAKGVQKQLKQTGHMCSECRFKIWDDVHGFYTCNLGVTLCVYRGRPACRKFEVRDGDSR